MASVFVNKIFDGFLAPKGTGNYWWKITQDGAWFFFAAPHVTNQSSFPQQIRIDRVKIETPESLNRRAWLTIVNDSAAKPPDFPWKDGCNFSVWAVSMFP